MGSSAYTFRNFCLLPLSRELVKDGELVALPASAFDCLLYLVEHRERPVGRDELISAVWGRTDVSDSLLAQTIVRLRRALDDTGDEQHSIRTVARVGYRWIADTTVTSKTQEEPATKTSITEGLPLPLDSTYQSIPASSPVRPNRFRLWLMASLAAVLIVAGAASFKLWRVSGPKPVSPKISVDRGAAFVLPAEVTAPEDWDWLHYGLMSLVSSQLQRARLPTVANETVVLLLKEDQENHRTDPLADPQLDISFLVQPYVALSNGAWTVRLVARTRARGEWRSEATSHDVLSAAREAVDLLLAQIGRSAPAEQEHPSDEQQLLLQRIDAARLAGDPSLARKLFDSAPEALRATPEIAYAGAILVCDSGDRRECEKEMLSLLALSSMQQNAVLRGRILITLGNLYLAIDQAEKGEKYLAEAVRVLQGQSDKNDLADAYLSHSYSAQLHWHLDSATSDLGRARVLYTTTDDVLGIARTDFQMGLISERRGQLEDALASLQRAYAQYAKMGMRLMLPVTLDAIAETQRFLLQFSDELKTTDLFWPLDPNLTDVHMRRELTLVRAIALADNGLTTEADSLAQELLREAEPVSDATVLAEAHELVAQTALAHNNYAKAAESERAALTPALQDADLREYAGSWLVLIRALQHSGHVSEARDEVAHMRKWSTALPNQDDWITIYTGEAEAEQTFADGHREAALDQFAATMERAQKLGVPDVLVDVGQSYALAALDAGRLDEAMAVSGTLSPWANSDMRAAWIEARVYRALGETDAWHTAMGQARKLAGERSLPAMNE